MGHGIPFAANGPLDPDDEEDWVVEIWVDVQRSKCIGEEEWDSRYGDGS